MSAPPRRRAARAQRLVGRPGLVDFAGRAGRAALTAVAALGLGAGLGCGPEVVIDEAALAASKPRSVAVLPFGHDPDALSDRAALRTGALRAAFARRFRERPYLHLKAAVIDDHVRAAGLDGEAMPAGADLARLGAALGVDALVLGRVTGHTNLQGGVIYRQTLEAEVRFVDAASGREIARARGSVADTGGLLLGSGQSLEAIEATIENGTDVGFLRLVDALAKDLARALPPPPEAPRLAPPRLDAVRVTAGLGAPLGAGSAIEVEAEGAPGLHAVLDLGLARAEIPMVEEAPGRYRGRYLVQSGDRFTAPVTVHVSDRFGVGAARTLRDTPVVVAAAPLGPPRGLDAALAGSGVRLRFTPAEGAEGARHRVYGLDRLRVPRPLADLDRPDGVVASGFESYVIVALDDRGALGRLAAVEAPRVGVAALSHPAPRGGTR